MTDSRVSVQKQLTVEAPQERAFRVFTENLDTWWPRSHHIGKAELKQVIVEPKANGRWYEQGVDGSECDWGKVLVWEPPRRVVLSWQISAAWQFDPKLHTELEVTFTPEGPKRTRVELEHRYLERYGAAAEEMRKTFDSQGGWNGMLGTYKQLAEK